jgi:hypothetical protein
MAISFNCRGCGASYSVKDEYAGKKTKCKKCGESISIPAPSAGDLDPPELGFLDTEPSRHAAPETAPLYASASNGSSAPARMPMRNEAEYASHGAPSVAPTVYRGPAPAQVAAGKASTRGPMRRNTAGNDGISLLVIAMFLLALIVQAISSIVQFPGEPPAGRTFDPDYLAALDQVGKPFAYVMLTPFALLIASFLVLGPAVMLAWFISSKIFRSEMPEGVYMRSVGLAVFPLALMSVCQVTHIDETGSLLLILFISSIPLAFAMIMLIHGERPGAAATITAFSCLFYIPAAIGAVLVAGLIVMGPKATYDKKISAIMTKKRDARDQQARDQQRAARDEEMKKYMADRGISTTPRTPGSPSGSSGGGNQQISAAQSEYDQKLRLIEIEAIRGAMEGNINRYQQGGPREAFTSDIEQIRRGYAEYEPRLGGASEWNAIREMMAKIEAMYAGFQSQEVDAEVFEPLKSTTPWDALPQLVEGFTPEMTVLKGFNLRMPKDARMDLSGDPTTSPTWKSPDGAVAFKMHFEERTDPKQFRPWVVVPTLSLIAREKGVAHIISDGHKSDVGVINKMPFIRGQRMPSEGVPICTATYMTLIGDRWLVAEIRSAAFEPNWFGQFDTALRTLRPLKEGEAQTDPFAPALVINRLGDATDRASELIRKAGPAAEDVVLAVASDAANPNRAAAVAILKDVGSAKCVPLLWQLSASPDAATYKAARAALVKLDPTKANLVDFCVADLKLPPDQATPNRKKDALLALAECKADERRAMVAPVLEQVLLDPAQRDIANETGKALFIWNRKETLDALLPALADQASEQNPALDAMLLAASGTGDKRAALPIIRWALKRPQAVSDACVVLGAPAEDELIKLLSGDANAKSAACDILQRMGTDRSVYMLDKVSRAKDSSDDLRTKARAAVAAVKAREAEKKSKKA